MRPSVAAGLLSNRPADAAAAAAKHNQYIRIAGGAWKRHRNRALRCQYGATDNDDDDGNVVGSVGRIIRNSRVLFMWV